MRYLERLLVLSAVAVLPFAQTTRVEPRQIGSISNGLTPIYISPIVSVEQKRCVPSVTRPDGSPWSCAAAGWIRLKLSNGKTVGPFLTLPVVNVDVSNPEKWTDVPLIVE